MLTRITQTIIITIVILHTALLPLTGSYIICNSPPAEFIGKNEKPKDYTNQQLMYKASLDDSERILTYFEITKHGAIRHFTTDLWIMSEIADVSNGSAVALKAGPNPPSADMIRRFSFTFTDKNRWKHDLSEMYIQPEGNSVHNGARLMAYPLDDNAAHSDEFRLTPVNFNQLQFDVNQKAIADKEAAFATSSDGQALLVAATAAATGNEERTELIEITWADPAKVCIGMNRLMLATFSDPVKNLSLSNDGFYSLSDEADVNETWRLFQADHIMPKPHDDDYIFGSQLKIVSKSGKNLSCTADGRFSTEDGPGAVWDILIADKHMYYIANHAYPFALARFNHEVRLLPKATPPDESLYWNVYDK